MTTQPRTARFKLASGSPAMALVATAGAAAVASSANASQVDEGGVLALDLARAASEIERWAWRSARD